MIKLHNKDKRESLIKIRENLEYCKNSKLGLLKEINKTNNQLKNKLVNKEEYNNFFSERFNGKTKLEWLDFCNKYITEKGELVNNHNKEIREKVYYNLKPLLPLSILLVLLIFALFLPLKPTGFITVDKEFNYSDNINLTIINSYEYTWLVSNYGNLKSIRLDGAISKEGSAKIYLQYNNKDYLIFDSSKLSEGIGTVTGLVIGDNINQSSLENIDASEPINNNSLKSIIITAQGGGSKAIDDLFKFNISPKFNWDIEHSKVCTKWDINSVSLCYGAEDCCNLINLESLGSWDSSFYLSYGRYGSGLENTIKAQVIYANYSLDIENPYSEIVYSNIETLTASFYKEVISFKDICIDTCLLPGFNETSYKLVFVAENASLRVDNVKYSIEKNINISENSPKSVKEIENITIYKDEIAKINLSQHFYDEDGNKLTYTDYAIENITTIIMYDTALLVPEYNFTGKRYMFFTASDGYYTTSSNIFEIRVIEKPLKAEDANLSEKLIKPSVVINKPVKWVKRINTPNNVINLSINISSDAINVTVRDVEKDKIIEEDKIKIIDRGIIKNISEYSAEKRIKQIKKIEDKLIREKEEIIKEDPTNKKAISSINEQLLDLDNEKNRLTGYVVAYKGKGLLTEFLEWLFNAEIIGYAVYEPPYNESSNTTSVLIEDIVKEIEIEYWTESPVSEEENITNGKRIIVSSDVHYEDILAYAYLNDASQNSIKLYHIVNGGRELVSDVSYYDKNNNGLIDYIEWVVPSLSNQTYEIIIITKAEHLDENRSLVSDVYDYVKEKDDNWTTIPNGHYVRVTFEIPLDKTRDITIYARSNGSAEIEVYTENRGELVTTFENITHEGWYSVYLSNLYENESYDVFDLKIKNTPIEFDYIVDPTITSKQAVTDSLLTDVIAETGQVNFTHLNISDADPYDNLVGYWSFDMDKTGDQNTVYDYTKNNFDGTLFDPAYIGVGVIGDALFVNGLDDNSNGVNITDSDGSALDITGAITVMAWVTKTSGSLGDNNAAIFARGGSGTAASAMQYQLSSADSTGNTIKILVSDGTTSLASRSPTSSMQYDKWYHVAGTYDGIQTTKFFVNSTQVDTDTNAEIGALTSVDTGTAIGGDTVSDRLYWNGTIDEVMVFNTNLSQSQIQAIYNNQSARFKATGKQILTNQTYLNITSGNNRVNVTTNFEANLGSQVNLSVGYYDGSWGFTPAQNLTANAIHTFNITSTSTNLTLNYTLIAGTNQFYTPILNGSIVFEAWSVSEITAPTVTLNSPPDSYYNDTLANTYFNCTATDTGGIKNISLYLTNSTNSSNSFVFNMTNSSSMGLNTFNTTLSLAGNYTWNCYSCDPLGNCGFASSNRTIIIGDYTYPNINFTSPTPPNGYSQTNNYTFVNVSASDTNNISTFIDFDNSLVGWWRFDILNSSGDGVIDESGHCYDNETEILTLNENNEAEWKYFADLNKTEKVATLNQETNELEWQLPVEWQEFNYDNEMYRIELEDGSDLLVSEKHRVYANSEEMSIESKSSVENILTLFCSLNEPSSDQIPALEANAKAKYCKSLSCGADCLDSSAYLLNSLNGTGSICFLICQKSKISEHAQKSAGFLTNPNTSASSSLVSLLFDNITSKFLPISKNKYSGATNSNFLIKELSKNTTNILPFVNNEEITLLQSTTTNIFYAFKDCKNLFDNDLSTFSDNSLTSFSVSFDLATILFNLASFSNSSLTVLVMNNDTSISGNSLISSSSSLGTANSTFILITNNIDVEKDLNKFRLVPITDVYLDINNDKQVYFLNALNEPVKVKSITKEHYSGKIYDVDVGNDIVLVRKKNDSKENKETPIRKTSFPSWVHYVQQPTIMDSNTVIFADAKMPYAKRIFPNFVTEKSSSGEFSSFVVGVSGNKVDLSGAVWSGNSNNGTAYGNAQQTDAGKLGKAFSFDGDGDYVDAGNGASLNLNGRNFSIFAWVNYLDFATDNYWEHAIIAKDEGPGATNKWIFTVTSETGGTHFEFYNTAGGGSRELNGNLWTVALGTWYHLGITREGSTFTFYRNGQSDGTATDSTEIAPVINANVKLGFAEGAYFNGTLDDVMLFNRSLSAEEIRGLYANTSTKYLSNNFTGLANGTHTFKAYAQDTGGNVNSTETRAITIEEDKIIPSFSNNQTNASSNTYNGTTVQINLTITDSGGVDFYRLTHNDTADGAWVNESLNDTSGSSVTAIFNYTIMHFPSTAGTMGWRVWANDTAGNVNLSNIYTFVVDLPRNINFWNCTTGTRNFSDASCWSLGSVPIGGKDIIFNGTGTGNCNITNTTMPQDLASFTVKPDYTGTIHFGPLFAAGTWSGNGKTYAGTQKWNVSGDINISGGTIKIYGDFIWNTSTDTCCNISAEGHGQEWRSINGDITIGSSAYLDGNGLGFGEGVGPGGSYAETTGATHGGQGGGNIKEPYGNATAPTSLGSGGENNNPAQQTMGGSAIKLHAKDMLRVDGAINMSSPIAASTNDAAGAGGSIWLKADNITGNGILKAEGGHQGSSTSSYLGGGGRVRLDYGSAIWFTGNISVSGGIFATDQDRTGRPGTLTFTNNTWPNDWTVNGTFGLLGGDYGEGEVINVLGNFVVPSGKTVYIYGDCFGNVTYRNQYVCYNTTREGKGVWINASGDITLSSGSKLDGYGLGFAEGYIGPGACGSTFGSAHGGIGDGCTSTYGNEKSPTSLGSSGGKGGDTIINAGSAIKLQTDSGEIRVDGEIDMMGVCGIYADCASGGSIWLKANTISGNGMLNASSPDAAAWIRGGGGGRIALTSTGTTNFSGIIENKGGVEIGGTGHDGSGGTVYINASTSIVSSMNVTAIGEIGGNITFWNTLIVLSGIYNASGSITDGNISLRYTDCDNSNVSPATFDPPYTNYSTCMAYLPPSSKRFIITGPSGSNIASLDNKGDMYLKGSVSESQSSLSPTPNSFIVQNSSMTIIAYINSTGYLHLRGTVTEKSDMSGMSNTNLEFRNASNNIIAFFDNKGNLKLKGWIGENYDNP